MKKINHNDLFDSISDDERITNKNEIIDLLEKIPENNLFQLLQQIIGSPCELTVALEYGLNRLFKEDQDFFILISMILEKLNTTHPKGNYLLLLIKEKILRRRNSGLKIVETILSVEEVKGYSSGICLGWLIGFITDSLKILDAWIDSGDIDRQTCALRAIYTYVDPENTNNEYFSDIILILEKSSESIIKENYYLYVEILKKMFEAYGDKFRLILMSFIEKHGAITAKTYINSLVEYGPFDITLLKKSLEILKSEKYEGNELVKGFIMYYKYDIKLVINYLRVYFKSKKQVTTFSKLYTVIGLHDKIPFIEMFDEVIDNNYNHINLTGHFILSYFFDKDLHEWILWCEERKDEEKAEKIILNSLKKIASKIQQSALVNITPQNLPERVISLIEHFVSNKDIDFKKIIKQFSSGQDNTEEARLKEKMLSYIIIINELLYPTIKIDPVILEFNLDNAPNLISFFGKKKLMKNSLSNKRLIIVDWFTHETISYEENEELKAFKQSKEIISIISSKRYRLLAKKMEYTLLQAYWERVFEILNNHKIKIPKRKLYDRNSCFQILTELSVVAALAPIFPSIKTEPDFPGLPGKKLDIIIEDEDEQVLLEVKVVFNPRETDIINVGHGMDQGKVKKTLLNVYRSQLLRGETDLDVPVIIVLFLGGIIDDFDIQNSIYGIITSGNMFNISDGQSDPNQSFTFRDPETSFFNKDENLNSDIITAIASIKQSFFTEHLFTGRLYRSPISPKNPISQRMWVKIRNALYGINYSNGGGEISHKGDFLEIEEIDECKLEILYQHGIEDFISILYNTELDKYLIPGFSNENLNNLKSKVLECLENR